MTITEERFRELATEAIDGVISAQGEAELKRYLDEHPVWKQEFEGMRSAVELIANVPELHPPVGLHSQIVGAVPFKEKRSLFAWIDDILPMAWMRYASLTAVGVLAGAFLLGPVVSDRTESNGLTATIGGKATASETITLAVPDGDGSMVVTTTDTGFDIAVNVNSEVHTEWTLTRDGQPLLSSAGQRANGHGVFLTHTPITFRLVQDGNVVIEKIIP